MRSLGFRIDAIRTPSAHVTAFDSDLFHIRTEERILETLLSFLPTADKCDEGVTPLALAETILQRLVELH